MNDKDLTNIDAQTVAGFGKEWQHFSQSELSDDERQCMFDDYFSLFPLQELSKETSIGVDIGCGSGRWAMLVAPLVKRLHVVDASHEALAVACSNLVSMSNVEPLHGDAGALPFDTASLDFAYSLGVLHHVPDTVLALDEAARVLKPGAPFLVYLYYAFDTRPWWFRMLWYVSELGRAVISRLPFWLRRICTKVVAFLVYWPLARLAKILESFNILPKHWPLAYYRDKSFYVMATDALDRLGTRLEKRFSKKEIIQLLKQAGFIDITFSDKAPYWCAVARKK